MATKLILPKGKSKDREQRLEKFADYLIKIQKTINFKISSRGWCYELEVLGLINKSEFDLAEGIINECRKKGYLPLDFTAQDESRSFDCIEEDPDEENIVDYLNKRIDKINEAPDYYNPSFWADKKYYIQVLVEKIDLKTLFYNICNNFNIPIATGKGWSDINQRGGIIKRFKIAEENGQIPILLYCGDYDPAGLKISDNLIKNIRELEKATGWNCDKYVYVESEQEYPTEKVNLIIYRFGLNLDFIIKHNLTWIDNLITGSGKDLGDPSHEDYKKPYVQKYKKDLEAVFGVGKWKRKCEANAIIVMPEIAQQLFIDTLKVYLGDSFMGDYNDNREEKQKQMFSIIKSKDFSEAIKQLKEALKWSI